MTARLDYSSAAPEALRPLYELSALLERSTLEPALRSLVQIRASQINGCAFCLNLHRLEAEALGERAERIMGLSAWREASWYSDRERAALALTEALTVLDGKPVGDDEFAQARAQFDERELVHLTLAISLINVWNRLNAAFKTPPEMAPAVYARLHSRNASAKGALAG